MREPDLADDLRPQPECAIDAPVADSDQAKGDRVTQRPDDREEDFGGSDREDRKGRRHERSQRRPDQVCAVYWVEARGGAGLVFVSIVTACRYSSR